jgi:hypothetical protein
MAFAPFRFLPNTGALSAKRRERQPNAIVLRELDKKTQPEGAVPADGTSLSLSIAANGDLGTSR